MRIIASQLLKRLGMTAIAVLLGTALVQRILAEAPEAALGLVVGALLASSAAYLIREACKKKTPRRAQGRARERTRVPIADFGED